jgi:FOG: FHA domain
VSAKHAVVTCEVKDAEASPPELEVKIVDLSRNGVTLNGVKLKKDEYVSLKDGDVVTLPFHLEYRFELNPEGTPPRSTRALLNGAPTPLQLKNGRRGRASGTDPRMGRTQSAREASTAPTPRRCSRRTTRTRLCVHACRNWKRRSRLTRSTND